MASKTKRVLQRLTPVGKITGGDPLILPNFNKGKAPESERDLANKKYVDDEIDSDILTHKGDASAHHSKTTSGDIDHDATVNTHNLTTDVDHATITNTHNLTTDVSHDSIADVSADDHHNEAHTHTHVSTTGKTANDHHNETHTIVSHDTTGTGANVTTLTDNSMADTLHRHSELSASDGTPDKALVVDGTGQVGIGTPSPLSLLDIKGGLTQFRNATLDNSSEQIRFGRSDVESDIRYHSIYTTASSTQRNNLMSFLIHDDVTNTSQTTVMTLRGNGTVGIGVTDPHSKLEVAGAISSEYTTIIESATNLDVSGINTLFVNPSGDTIITGFTGGVAGQVLRVAATNISYDITMVHNSGTQKVFLHAGVSEELTEEYGGWTLVCDGSNWYDTEHSKHV